MSKACLLDITKNFSNQKMLAEISTIALLIIVVSDYAKGLISAEFLSLLKEYASENDRKVIIDLKSEHKAFYSGAYLIIPKQNEAMDMSGASLKDASIIANHAAGLAVEIMGAASVSKTELDRALMLFFFLTKRSIYNLL